MKNKKHLYIYLILTFILVVLISIFTINIYNNKKLDSEVKALLKKDVSKDKFSTNTKTFFKYSKVEKAIKEYMKDYSDNIKKANNIINDETIKKILSTANIESDGPNFDVSLKLLEENLKTFNKTIDTLNKMTAKKEIMKYIEDYNLSDKYVKLYKDYMFGKEYSKDIENNKVIINNISITGLNVLNTDIEVLKLLKDNPDGWVMKDGSINFYSNDMMNKYNELIEKINH